jgi:hypothetical protein
MTLLVARDPQPQQVLGAIHVAPLELARRHSHVLGDALQISLRQIHKALLLATICASWLAFESQACHSVLFST